LPPHPLGERQDYRTVPAESWRIAVPIVAGQNKSMRQFQHVLAVGTVGKGLTEITREVKSWAGARKITAGILTVYCRHTSASLLIQENADPDVQKDLKNFFEDIAPESRNYIHDTEGPDDMPAHIRTALTHTSLSIPVMNGELALGTWQGIFLFEHRASPHRREIVLHLTGE
jgi:secondary thiamine-phosphate synthase enzyme